MDGLDPEPGKHIRSHPVSVDHDWLVDDPVDALDIADHIVIELKSNRASASEVWLVYYKKHTGKPSISYIESVKEAICFGWIDGLKKRLDDERYMHRFTPRRPGSKWSPTNIKLAKELIESGLMTDAGLEAFRQGKTYDKEFLQANQQTTLAPEYERALKKNGKAWTNFNNLAPSHRKNYIGWLQGAKKPETRAKRLKELISVLENDKKLGMK